MIDTSSLNEKQKIAVSPEFFETPVLVIAGPGSGKTQILTTRIALMLESGIEPYNILCLTYTETGAREMRNRLVNKLNIPQKIVDELTITTFHGFCANIRNIDKFRHLFGEKKLIDDLEKYQIIRDILESENIFPELAPRHDIFANVGKILSMISSIKVEGYGSEFFANQKEILQQQINSILADIEAKELANVGKKRLGTSQARENLDSEISNLKKINEFEKILIKYQQCLNQKKLFDFEDMILEVVNALETNPELLLYAQEHYSYILLDEYQDTNDLQSKIVYKLASYWQEQDGSGASIFAVGDDDQSIYKFQGASIHNILGFKERYPQAQVVVLEENYRSHSQIISGARNLVANNSATIDKALGIEKKYRAARTNLDNHTDHIKFFECQDTRDQMIFVYSEICDILEREKDNPMFKLSDIAILFRSRKNISGLPEFFRRKNISIEFRSKENLLLSEPISSILELLSLIVDPQKNDKFFSVLSMQHLNISNLELFKFNDSFNKRNHQSRLDSGEISMVEFALCSDNEHISTIGQKIIDLNVVLKHKESTIHTVSSTYLRNLTIDILNEFNIFQALSEGILWQDIMDPVEKINTFLDFLDKYNIAKPEKKFGDLMSDLFLMQAYGVPIEEKKDKPINKNAIQITTAHGSKGEEYKYVFLVGANAPSWEKQRNHALLKFIIKDSAKVDNDIEEERRLFYVAITRAKDYIYIISPRKNNLTNVKDVPISTFVSEIIDTTEHDNLANNSDIVARIESLRLTEYLLEDSTGDDRWSEDLGDNNVFLEKLATLKLSPTAITDYIECPYRFKLRYLLNLPTERKYIFGNLVHESLAEFARYINTLPVEDIANISNVHAVNFLVKKFGELLKDEDVSKIISERELDRAKVLFNLYVGNYREYLLAQTPYIEKAFYTNIDDEGNNIALYGRIDRLENISGSESFRIVDFKTGKPRSWEDIKKEKPNYMIQLKLYKLLVESDKSFSSKIAELTIDGVDLDKDNNLSGRLESINFSSEEIQEIIDMIKSIHRDIRDQKFHKLGKSPSAAPCNFCSYKNICWKNESL